LGQSVKGSRQTWLPYLSSPGVNTGNTKKILLQSAKPGGSQADFSGLNNHPAMPGLCWQYEATGQAGTWHLKIPGVQFFPLEKGGSRKLRILKQPVVFLRKISHENAATQHPWIFGFYFYFVKIAVRRFTGLQASGAHTKCETLAKNGLTAVFRGVTAYIRYAS
jgi:hypothetical protein